MHSPRRGMQEIRGKL